MNTLLYNYTLLIIALLAPIMPVLGQQKVTKTYEMRQSVNADALVQIDNRYGLVHVNIWDKNEVTLSVETKVEGRDEAKAREILNRIRIGFTQTPSKVTGTTSISGNMNSKNGKSSFSIDYTINMPASCNLTIENRFGDIYVERLAGVAEIDLRYGSIRSGSLENNKNNVELQFSNGTMEMVKGGTIKLQYSNLRVQAVENIIADTQFSELSVTAAGSVDLKSQYDTNEFVAIGILKARSQFSTLSVGYLIRSLDLDTQYGSVKISEISADAERLVIENQFGDVTVYVPASPGLTLEGKSSFGSISVDRSWGFKRSESTNSGSVSGTVGNGATKIQANSRFGDVTIKSVK